MKSRKERKSEIICRKSFAAFLKENFGADDIRWEIVQHDPPDYYMTLYKHARFAVEVTESKVYCQSLIDKVPVLEREYREYHTRFVTKFETEARKKKILRGTYIISFQYPVFKQKNYKKILSKIIEQYNRYLRGSYHSESKDKMDLYYDGIWISSIEKINSDRNVIYPSIGVRFAFVDSSENIAIVKNALQQAIYEKKEKLERNAIRENKILLFYDSYLLDEKSTYSFEYNTLENIEYFHTIYIYLPFNKSGFIYYCRDPEIFRKNRSTNN